MNFNEAIEKYMSDATPEQMVNMLTVMGQDRTDDDRVAALSRLIAVLIRKFGNTVRLTREEYNADDGLAFRVTDVSANWMVLTTSKEVPEEGAGA